MVFAKTWSEELVAEWLTTQGFAVLVNVPIGTGRRGGRIEADVVGFKITDRGSIEIRHYEILTVSQSAEKVAKQIADKFYENRTDKMEGDKDKVDRIEGVKNYVKMIIGTNRVFEYKKIAILFCSPRTLKKIKKELEGLGYRDIELWSFEEFFKSQVMDIVKEKAQKKRTFPDSLWLLNMLYVLCDKKLLAGCHHL